MSENKREQNKEAQLINSNQKDLNLKHLQIGKAIPLNFFGKDRIFIKDPIGYSSFIFAVIILILIPISYYSIIIPQFPSIVMQILFSILSIPFFILSYIYFINSTTIPPGYLENTNDNSPTFEEYNINPTTITIKDKNYTLPYCTTCKLVREIRSFHCSRCGRCIKRHDHHCAFVNNCVGKNNHKDFFLFILNSFISSILILSISLFQYIKFFFNTEKTDILKFVHILLVMIASGSVVLAMGNFLISHLILISKNITTNESIRKKYNDNAFDKGCNGNWREVWYQGNQL